MVTNWTSLELSSGSDPGSVDLVFCHGAPVTLLGDPGAIDRVRAIGGEVTLDPDPGATMLLAATTDCRPLLLVRLAVDGDRPGRDAWMIAGKSIVEAMAKRDIAQVRLPDSRGLGGDEALRAVLEGLFSHGYRFSLASAEGTDVRVRAVVVAATDRAAAEDVCRTSGAVNRARAWTAQPANRLTPPRFAREAADVLGRLGAAVRIIGPDALEDMGAGLLTAVGWGSAFGSHLFVAEWRGDPARQQWDAVLVGKGLTFDSGGLNLKGKPGIAKMKFDKAGAAAVLGAMEAAITRRSRANVVAVIPMAENAIDALSYRPGDVLTSLAGLTVEVADTDAEGRLALADAMTFGIREYRPTYLVDLATLTGTVAVLLYQEFAGLFATDDRLAIDLLRAGEESGDRLWRLPLDRCHDHLIESDIADLANLGPPGLFGNAGGSPVAGAKFLQRFSGDTRWAHIDMTGAAVAMHPTPREGAGATGFGARLLDCWLLSVERKI